MLNLETFDTFIAVVIVILVSSLVVQLLHAFIKKICKLKSLQNEVSLVDLFENALTSRPIWVQGRCDKSKYIRHG